MYFIFMLTKGQAHFHMIMTKHLLPLGQEYLTIARLKPNSTGYIGKSLLNE